MNCCQQGLLNPMESTMHALNNNYLNNNNNNNNTRNHSFNGIDIPKLNVFLDLPDEAGYLPTYWPGQYITGQLKLSNIQQNIKVHHLRIVLFGHVQIYGDSPELPCTAGLFDNKKNEQLVNTGVRVIRDRPSQLLETIPIYPQFNLTSHEKQQQSAEDEYLENIIKKVTTLDHAVESMNEHNQTAPPVSLYYQQPILESNQNDVFELDREDDQQYIDFSIRVPNGIIHTLDHQNYPISYRIVTLMHCQIMNQPVLCYSTKKIRIESFLSSSVSIPITTNPIFQIIHQSDEAWLHSICTKILSRSTQLSQWAVQQKKQLLLNSNNCYLKTYIELNEILFERDQYVPFNVVLENHAFSWFKISNIQMQIELRKKINLTCSVDEQVEQEIIESKNVELKDISTNTNHAMMVLHLPQIIKVPKDCACSIDSKLSAYTFSLNYEISVKLTIAGSKEQRQTEQNHDTTPDHHYIDEHHIVVDHENTINDNISKSYSLELDPLPILIGNKRRILE